MYDYEFLTMNDTDYQSSSAGTYSSRNSISRNDDRIQFTNKLRYLQHMKEVMTVTSVSYE